MALNPAILAKTRVKTAATRRARMTEVNKEPKVASAKASITMLRPKAALARTRTSLRIRLLLARDKVKAEDRLVNTCLLVKLLRHHHQRCRKVLAMAPVEW
jgi:hypothetical protein